MKKLLGEYQFTKELPFILFISKTRHSTISIRKHIKYKTITVQYIYHSVWIVRHLKGQKIAVVFNTDIGMGKNNLFYLNIPYGISMIEVV